jgi:hypothetical protein
MIIDPPPVSYGPPEAILAWLAELSAMKQDDPSVMAAIAEAKKWLDDCKEMPIWRVGGA